MGYQSRWTSVEMANSRDGNRSTWYRSKWKTVEVTRLHVFKDRNLHAAGFYKSLTNMHDKYGYLLGEEEVDTWNHRARSVILGMLGAAEGQTQYDKRPTIISQPVSYRCWTYDALRVGYEIIRSLASFYLSKYGLSDMK